MREVNYSKFTIFPIWAYSSLTEMNQEKKTFKILETNNSYKYKELKNKMAFILIKYLPSLLLLMMITKYEIQNMYIEILLGSLATTLGVLTSLKYKDFWAVSTTIIWLLLLSFVNGIETLQYIVKYSLISYILYQFLFDLKRKYFEVLDESNNLVSYAYIKREKIWKI